MDVDDSQRYHQRDHHAYFTHHGETGFNGKYTPNSIAVTIVV